MLELWGGHECTVNRVGDRYRDQTIRSGHHDRPGDLERLAELGIRALRYPVLWERVAGGDGEALDWRWSDERLDAIRRLGMRPIVGLLHHGSGPRFTHLLDPDFSTRFARYAGQAAARYPWVEAWTPINEPLTTARFSALYGHWYPHVADERGFWTALVNQIDGIRLGRAAIRDVTSSAILIQTEDLGRTYGTSAVAHQTDFDNARRWMTWDLLCGAVTPTHPLWDRLARFGLEDRLRAISDAPCPPDILGVNHYLTSDRFLDHRVAAYPADRRGGNAFMSFADVEAIRVASPAPAGLRGALEEAWARYGRPLAVTECHNGCTREDQVRWLRDAWETARDLRHGGMDLRAVTAWSLLGSFDWCSLLTRDEGRYEVGAFDIRGPVPRPTAVAAEIARLGGRDAKPAPGALGAGWWRRDTRLQFAPVSPASAADQPRAVWRGAPASGPPILITGATGTLGRALAHACEARGLPYRLTRRRDLDLSDEDGIGRVLDAVRPWAVINAAGWVRVDDAEHAVAECRAGNLHGALRLATATVSRGLAFASFSSDLVFDGTLGRPYVESDAPAPRNVYGASKADAEAAIQALGGHTLMIRTAAFFSPHDAHNFAVAAVRALAEGRAFQAADDLVVSPTYVPDLVAATLDLLIDGDTGVRHLANAGETSWADFARSLAEALKLDGRWVEGVPHARFGWAARRPSRTGLGTSRGQILPPLADAIRRFAAHDVIPEPAFAPDASARPAGLAAANSAGHATGLLRCQS